MARRAPSMYALPLRACIHTYGSCDCCMCGEHAPEQICLPSAERRLNQHVFAGPHGSSVTESHLQVIEELAEKLSELAMHHEELKAQV